MATQINMIANVPEIILFRYKMPIPMATNARKVLSKMPTFFFMIVYFKYEIIVFKSSIASHN